VIVSRKHGLKILNGVSASKLLGLVASEARAARYYYERWSISQSKWSIGASGYLLCLPFISPSVTPLPDPQSSPSISASRKDPCGGIPQDRLSPRLGIKSFESITAILHIPIAGNSDLWKMALSVLLSCKGLPRWHVLSLWSNTRIDLLQKLMVGVTVTFRPRCRSECGGALICKPKPSPHTLLTTSRCRMRCPLPELYFGFRLENLLAEWHLLVLFLILVNSSLRSTKSGASPSHDLPKGEDIVKSGSSPRILDSHI
jgi:hypothetical protein